MLEELKTIIEENTCDVDWWWTHELDNSVSFKITIDKKDFTIVVEIPVDNISSEKGALIEDEIIRGEGGVEIKKALEEVAAKILPTLRRVLQ